MSRLFAVDAVLRMSLTGVIVCRDVVVHECFVFVMNWALLTWVTYFRVSLVCPRNDETGLYNNLSLLHSQCFTQNNHLRKSSVNNVSLIKNLYCCNLTEEAGCSQRRKRENCLENSPQILGLYSRLSMEDKAGVRVGGLRIVSVEKPNELSVLSERQHILQVSHFRRTAQPSPFPQNFRCFPFASYGSWVLVKTF